MLIEDNPKHARLTIKILSAYGHEITHADNAMNGLRMIQATPPELVLLDMNLPDLDGKTLANRLRRLACMRTVPVVALTADNSPQTQRLAIAFGCDGFISKPIDVRQFPQQIETYLAAGVAMRNAV